jgi:hypothetical protein
MTDLNTGTIWGMIVFAVIIAGIIYLIWPRKEKPPDEPDEFDPSQIF